MAALSSLVEFQLKSATDLSLLLEKEKAAIASRVAKEIEQLAKEKLTLINQLQQTDQRISQHPDVATLTNDPELSPLVDQIRSIVHDCQQANAVNGEALQRAQLSFNKLNNLMATNSGQTGYDIHSRGSNQECHYLRH